VGSAKPLRGGQLGGAARGFRRYDRLSPVNMVEGVIFYIYIIYNACYFTSHLFPKQVAS